MAYTLHIGDPAYSSWSLRGWLLLRAFGIPFETRLHRMCDPAFDAYRASQAPARTVPMLEWRDAAGAIRVWDSLAIAETLAERHPDAGLWPSATEPRAAARTLSAEMHAGFAALRAEAPMNTRRHGLPVAVSAALRADMDRLAEIWVWALERFGGPWLAGGRFCAADAFFAPVAFRIVGYALPADDVSLRYAERLPGHQAVAEWRALADLDPRRIDYYETI
jgi:glutathione S-transferase